jgi:hypothetical protein
MTSDDTPLPNDSLRDAALRLTAASPEYVGFWLARHREHERLSERDLLLRLKVKFIKLPLVALCTTPRADHFDEDVQTVAARYGADPTALADLIRREQARHAARAVVSKS